MAPLQYTAGVKLSRNLEVTPEGFLWCRSVPVARLGLLLYAPHETPVKPGPDGITRIEVRSECLFDPESMASLEGKSVVNEHPPQDLNNENWMMATLGEVHNPRRGEGVEDDLLLCDFLVKDRFLIEDILGDKVENILAGAPIKESEGKREVSLGYDAKYHDIGGGRGYQSHRIYNHAAIVESGRCGSKCSVRDAAAELNLQPTKESLMAKTLSVVERIKDAFRTRDAKSLDEALDEISEHDRNEGKSKDSDSLEAKHEELHKRLSALEEAHKGHEKKVNDCMSKLATHDSDIEMLKEKAGVEETKDSAEEREKERTKDKHRVKDAESEKKADAEYKRSEEVEGKGKDKKGTKDEDMGEGDTVTDEALEEETEEGHEGEAHKAKDSAFLQSAYTRTIQFAEIIAPGMSYKTMDASATPQATYKQICNMRRKALIMGTHDVATLNIMEEVADATIRRTVDARTITEMPCSKVKDFFFAVGVAKKRATRDSQQTGVGSYTNDAGFGGGNGVVGKFRSLADINEANRKAYAATRQ